MIIRETSAKFAYQENGEIKQKDIRVQYRSVSIKQIKEQKTVIAAKGDDAYITDTVFMLVESLPDLTNNLTLEFLEEMELENVKAIKQAIDDDIDPK